MALVIVNQSMKFHKICFNNYYKVIAKVKVCHNPMDNNNNDYTTATVT